MEIQLIVNSIWLNLSSKISIELEYNLLQILVLLNTRNNSFAGTHKTYKMMKITYHLSCSYRPLSTEEMGVKCHFNLIIIILQIESTRIVFKYYELAKLYIYIYLKPFTDDDWELAFENTQKKFSEATFLDVSEDLEK